MKHRATFRWIHDHWGLIAAIGLVMLTSLIFAYRYQAALSMPNFYAEDGTVFLKNIIDHNIIGATLTAFNGYLVVGQYMVMDAAYATYSILGLSFTKLPLLIAICSCLFLGLTASLPFILFRRELGWVVAIVTSILLAFTPMPGSDYAIIGTIGNLKFAFLFWATLLIIYRNIHYKNTVKTVITDCLLLLCVLTNGPVVVLLPFILWPYRKEIIGLVKNKRLERGFFKRTDVISAFVLAFISALYLAVVYLKGIPVLQDYLNGPYNMAATDNIIYRVTVYSWLYPLSQFHEFITALPRSVIGLIVVGLLALLLGWVYFINKRGKRVFSFGLFAIAVSTLAFVATRPGIGDYMLEYIKFPDQFFYTQSLIFVFITMWVIAPYIKSRGRQIALVVAAVIFICISARSGSSWGENAAVYQQRGNIYDNTYNACHNGKEQVTIPVYPTEIWNITVDRDLACK